MTFDATVPDTKDRFAFVHALRGVAALLVVWSHLSGFWLSENGLTSEIQDLSQKWVTGPLHIFENGGLLGVVLFFLVSGYIITHTSLRESYGAFAVKRALRIAPSLFVATLVSFLLLLVAGATNTKLIGINAGGLWHWLSALVLVDGFTPGGRAMNVTWTLVVEVIFYLITFALLGISKRRPLRALWMMSGVWVVLSLVSLSVAAIDHTDNRQSALCVGFLIIGRTIYLWHRGIIRPFDAALNVATVALIYCLLVEVANPGFLVAPGGWVGYEPAVTFIFAILIFVCLMRFAPRRVLQPIRLLGDASYSLYLLHIPVGITVLNLLHGLGVPNSLNTIIAIVVSVAVSYVAFRVIEVPSQNFARSLLASRRTAATAAGGALRPQAHDREVSGA